MTRLAFILALVLVAASVSAQAPPDPKQQLANAIDALGQCRVEVGQLMSLQAAVVRGTLLDQAGWLAKFERDNPGKTIGADGKIADKPEPKPEKQGGGQ